MGLSIYMSCQDAMRGRITLQIPHAASFHFLTLLMHKPQFLLVASSEYRIGVRLKTVILLWHEEDFLRALPEQNILLDTLTNLFKIANLLESKVSLAFSLLLSFLIFTDFPQHIFSLFFIWFCLGICFPEDLHIQTSDLNFFFDPYWGIFTPLIITRLGHQKWNYAHKEHCIWHYMKIMCHGLNLSEIIILTMK